jgi:uncharacterized Zn finger protein (UPF0148 family)
VKHHIGETNEMSETPRVDAVWELFATDTTLEPDVEFSTLARQLERELNEANDRIKRLEEARTVAAANSLATMMSYEDAIAKIKRLEEAGDEMANAYEEICHDSYDQKQIANWRKAKEAKL